MYARQARGCWASGEDGGSKDVLRNPRFQLRLNKPANVKCAYAIRLTLPTLTSSLYRIRLQTPTEPRLISLAIYSATPDGEPDELLSSSGSYADYPCGVLTSPVRLEPREHGESVNVSLALLRGC